MTEYTVTEGEDLNINISVMVNGALSRSIRICLGFQDGTDKALEFNVDTSDSAVMTLQIPFNELPVSEKDSIMLTLNTMDKLVELGDNVTILVTIEGKLYTKHSGCLVSPLKNFLHPCNVKLTVDKLLTVLLSPLLELQIGWYTWK